MKGILRLLYGKVKAEYDETLKLLNQVHDELDEARQQGDLSENSDYDAAKAKEAKTVKKLAELSDLLESKVLDGSTTPEITPGDVLEIVIYGQTKEFLDNENLSKYIESTIPRIEGRVLFGGATHQMTLTDDFVLSDTCSVGAFICGKPSGIFSIKSPGGFTNIKVSKVQDGELYARVL